MLIDDFERSMASVGRIFGLLRVPIKIKDTSDSVSPDANGYDIKFENVSFGYQDNVPLFRNLSMEIPHGTSIGLVGDTGSGKTTIAKLLLRLYELQDGNIYIGGHSIASLSIDYLREKSVCQSGVIFIDASIFDNITYGVKEPNNVDVEQAIEKASARSLLTSFLMD